jgi:hypothetical protein
LHGRLRSPGTVAGSKWMKRKHKMIKNPTINKVLWFLIASLALIAAGIGVINQDIYRKVISTDLLPGTVAQEFITILAGLVLLYLSFMTKDGDIKNRSWP